MKPRLPKLQDVEPYLREMSQNGIFSNFGPLVSSTERRFASLLGVDPLQVVSAVNATQALIGALQISGVQSWTIPAYTFAATGHAVLQSGKSIHFQDIETDTWLARAESPLESSSEGLLPVVPFGTPVDLTQWTGVKHVIVDAAASLGNVPKGLAGLPTDWAVVFSLHATKVLAAGEGGLVVFGDVNAAREFRRWTNFGFDEERASQVIGSNAKMSEVTGAYANAALDDWPRARVEWNQARDSATAISRRLNIQPVALPGDEVSPYWIVQFNDEKSRNMVEAHLQTRLVSSRRWWPTPLPDMPAFRKFSNCDHPNARAVSGTVLGLPFYRSMTAEAFDLIEEVLVEALSTHEGLT